MKLVRFGEAGQEKPGLVDASGVLRDLSGQLPDIGGDVLDASGLERISQLDHSALPEVSGDPRLGPPVAGVSKIICVGLNYADHAKESGQAIPEQPILFMKPTNSIVGAFDDVIIPHGSTKTDWEVELGVVIGKTARRVSEADALEHVAGYLVVNDVSEREFQLEHGGQWVKGKGADTFAPLGPWLVTRDEVSDPQGLNLSLEVNGHRYQDGNTQTMIFGVVELVSYISRYMTLLPGDVISTGTPPGVGLGQKPQVYLKPGDVMELSVAGLGVQRQNVVAAA